jgi:hypothetical protein
MANYLQRVITAGARIHSPAKPPVAAPTILPAAFVAPPAPTAPDVSLPRSTKRAVPQTPERIVPPIEKSTVPTAPPQAVPPIANRPPVPLSVAIARLTSGPPIRAPRGIRADVPLPQPPRAEVPRIEMPHIASKPTEPSPKPAVAHPDAEPRATTPPPEIQKPAFDADVHVAPVPAAPIALPQYVPVSEAKQESKPPVQKQSPRKPPEPTPVQPRIEPRHVDRPTKLIEETSVRATPPIEAKPAPAQRNPKIEPIRIKPKSSEQPLTPAIAPERTESRKSRITIGQVDVQVNNQRAAPATAPAPAAGPRTDFFEARYLNRFSMRP